MAEGALALEEKKEGEETLEDKQEDSICKV